MSTSPKCSLFVFVLVGCAASSQTTGDSNGASSSEPRGSSSAVASTTSSTPSPHPTSARAACKSAEFVDTRGKPPASDPMTPTTPGRDVKFGDATCRGDREVWRDAEQRLRVCTLRSPATIAGFPLAGDNYTLFHDNGVPEQTTLAKALTAPNKAGVSIDCAAGFAVIDRDRNIEGCVLAHGARFGEIAARGGGDVFFHPDGSLWAAVIDLPITVLGHQLVPGARVSFHPSGRVAEAHLDDPATIAGFPILGSFTVHESGGLASFTLAEAHRVGRLDLEAFAEVWLYEDGSPWHVEFVTDSGFMVHGEPWTDTRKMTFDCDGHTTHDETEHYQSTARPPRFH
ncbi:MAG: hypothetical protein U0271_16995 [Polyangiaceae bacterium]